MVTELRRPWNSGVKREEVQSLPEGGDGSEQVEENRRITIVLLPGVE